ncbi:MAG: hypothetical protein KGN80_00115 [Acidobacteriota bacterium]|nr:hypothetical protein [Acidobacteriota bacterium]
MNNPYFKFDGTNRQGDTPTRRDGYVYSLEYWETLHRMQLLFDKNQGWAPNTGHDDPASLAELDQWNAMNAEVNEKTAAAVKANDPDLYDLQLKTAAYKADPTPENLEAYELARAKHFESNQLWLAAQVPKPSPKPTTVAPRPRFRLSGFPMFRTR